MIRIYCSLIALFFCISITFLISNTTHAYAQLQEFKNQTSRLYYGCQQYSGVFHCDRLHNKFESHTVESSSSTIYHVTDKPMFVDGRERSAIQMYANQLKSIIFSNTSEISTRQFSVSFWVKGINLPDDTFSPEIGHIVSHFGDQFNGGWSFNAYHMQNLSEQTLSFIVFNKTGTTFSPPEVPIYRNGSFAHIVGTFDGSSVKVYKDGRIFGETKFNGTYDSNINAPLTLGVASGDPMQLYWTGVIDDLRYYNKAISSDEVRRIYDIQNPDDDASRSDLIGQWRFDGNLKDNSGNNLNGRERTLISSMVFAPDGRLFFSEKDTGNIKIMENGQVNLNPFVTIHDYYSNWEQGLLGLALDPDFNENHFIYLFYTSVDNSTSVPFNRIVRFTDVNNHGVNKTIILNNLPASKGYHSGGAMAFGLDKKLYVTVGDATEHIECGNLPNSNSTRCPAQDPSSLLGKVLRINRDGSFPKDNPYPNSPVYNIGHVNMYGIAFDHSGFGLVSENGDWLYDEINTLEKGANYGSPTLQPFNIDPEFSNNSSTPIRSYYIPNCLTQMIYYEGNKIPELKGKFLVGALTQSNPIFALDVDTVNKRIIGEEVISLDNFPNNQVVALAESPEGDIYYASYDINRLDSINRNNKSQIMFPIEINYLPFESEIADLSFIPSNNEIKINFVAKNNYNNSQSNHNSSIFPNAYTRVDIPKKLLDQITNVKASTEYQNKTQDLRITDFTIKNATDANYTSVSVSLKDNYNYTLSIFGNKSLS